MSKRGKVVPIGLTPVRAMRLLREIAKDSRRVYFTDHAERRMLKRHITRMQVMRCLSEGTLTKGPLRDKRKDNWKMTLKVFSAGETVTVVVALDRDKAEHHAIVITVY